MDGEGDSFFPASAHLQVDFLSYKSHFDHDNLFSSSSIS
jgi:hypothetical protein